MKEGRPLPRRGAGHTGRDRAVLPSLVTAKLAVYETMRARGWSKLKLAKQLGMQENAVRRLLDLRHSSHMWVIDAALAKMNAELSIGACAAHAVPVRRPATPGSCRSGAVSGTCVVPLGRAPSLHALRRRSPR